MIYLNPKSLKNQFAFKTHVDSLIKLINNRVKRTNNLDLQNLLDNKIINKILSGDPNDLIELNNSFYRKIPNHSLSGFEIFKNNINTKHENLTNQNLKRNRVKYEKLHKELSEIFNYQKSFARKDTKYSAYNLANNLNIKTCTYCNRMYTKTVVNPKKITRPEFDHWLPKGKFPLLALSFYNLIPSCHICNSSVKGDIDFTLDTHIHPYLDKKINCQFSYEYDDGLTKHNFKIKYLGDNGKTKRTIEDFKIYEIYESHEDEINDLLRIKNAYSPHYLQNLKSILNTSSSSVTDNEIYRLAFGTSLKESSFEERPLSKMKRDILLELGIINNETK